MEYTDTVIIGGGQAGLAMSRCLVERGVEHVVLERGRVGERWRTERWDSLRLLTPNWQSRLPHFHWRRLGRARSSPVSPRSIPANRSRAWGRACSTAR